eukprot:gene5055-10123_t
MAIESGQFLFREHEFEDDDFHPAAFVAKYRRITSLESLRDQLRQYSSSLKDQLYDIINRDYKDFITIATKLDGVDTRVDHLRKPLSDLRVDLLALHHGMVSSMQAIQDKLSNKIEITSRRKHLEASLACIEKLDIVEDIIGNVSSIDPTTSTSTSYPHKIRSKRRQLIRAAEAYTSATSTGTGTDLDTFPSVVDLLECSELERAASSLSDAMVSLSALTLLGSNRLRERERERGGGGGVSTSLALPSDTINNNTTNTTNTSTSTSANSGVLSIAASSATTHGNSSVYTSPSTIALGKSLELRAHKLQEALLLRLRKKLTVLLEATVNTNVNVNVDVNQSQSFRYQDMAFVHCVRALMSLSRGSEAEAVVVAVRGTSGWYGGEGVLCGAGRHAPHPSGDHSIPIALRPLSGGAVHPFTQNIISSSSSSSPSVDLLVNGVWAPVVAVLHERFPSMLTTGIACTFQRCYSALERFAEGEGKNTSSSSRQSFQCSMGTGGVLPGVLRSQEICTRIETACTLVMKHGITFNVCTAIYPDSNAATTTTTTGSTATDMISKQYQSDSTHPSSLSLSSSIKTAELNTLYSMLSTTLGSVHMKVPLLAVLCVEMLTCVHTQEVLLSPLIGRFFALATQAMIRIEVLVAQWASVSTPSFNKESILAATANASGAMAMDTDGNVQSTPNSSSTSTVESSSSKRNLTSGTSNNTLVNVVATPSKTGGGGPTVVTLGTPSTQPPGSAAAVPVTTNDVILLIACYSKVLLWIKDHFCAEVESRLIAILPVAGDVSATVSPVRRCLQRQCDKGERTVRSLWGRVYHLLEGECKQTLQAVRAIAGKYRMTNKPPPETQSPYVTVILQPIRTTRLERETVQGIEDTSLLLNIEFIVETSFREKFPGARPVPLSQATHTYTPTVPHTSSTPDEDVSYDNTWEKELAEKVTAHFLQLVAGLIDTVRQMDNALQRRNRTATAMKQKAANAPMSDSEKIQLQVLLDVKAYGLELTTVGLSPETSPAYKALLAEVEEMQKVVNEASS